MAESTLIPGDPGGLAALATAWRSAAEQVDLVHGDIAANGLEGSWSGLAANAFRGALQGLHGELAPIAPAIDAGGSALAGFARELEELQAGALRQQQAMEEAEQHERDASARSQDARLKLDAARTAQSVAVDPVSLNTAKAGVDTCEDLFAIASRDVEDAVARVSEVAAGLRALEVEYEQAVGRCVATLGAARHAAAAGLTGWLERTLPVLAGAVLEQAGVIWRELAQDPARDLDVGELVTGFIAVSDWIAEHKDLTSINSFDVFAVQIGRSPIMKYLGWAGVGVGLYQSTSSALQYTQGLTWEGRASATADMDGISVLLTDPQLTASPVGVVQAANLLSGNAVGADLDAFALMKAGLISGFQTGGVKGAIEGAAQELNVWDQAVESGKFGPIVEGIAKVGDAIVEHPGQVAADVAHAVGAAGHAAVDVAGDVAGGVGHAAADVAGGVGHVAADVAGGVGHVAGAVAGGVGHAAADVASGVGHAASDVAGGVGHAAGAVASGVGHAASDVAGGVGHAAADVASGVGHAASDVAGGAEHAVGDVASLIGL